MKIATIGLQWNPKPKMMRTVEIIAANIFTAVEAAASRDDKRIIQMINTLKRALKSCVVPVGRGAIRHRSHWPKPRARRSATPSRRNAAPTTWRTAPACRRVARLRCSACRRTCRACHQAVRTAVRAVEAPAAATAKPADTAAPKAAAPAAAATAAPKGPLRQPLRDSQAARRFPPSAAPAAPTIRKSARACRPAAHRRCNAWKRTRPNFPPVARRPFPPPAVVRQQRLHQRQARRRPLQERLPPRRRP